MLPSSLRPAGLSPHLPRTPIRQVAHEDLWFFVFRDVKSEYRWRLIAGNNKRIAASGEGYKNRSDCIHAVNLVASSGGKPIVYAPNARR